MPEPHGTIAIDNIRQSQRRWHAIFGVFVAIVIIHALVVLTRTYRSKQLSDIYAKVDALLHRLEYEITHAYELDDNVAVGGTRQAGRTERDFFGSTFEIDILEFSGAESKTSMLGQVEVITTTAPWCTCDILVGAGAESPRLGRELRSLLEENGCWCFLRPIDWAKRNAGAPTRVRVFDFVSAGLLWCNWIAVPLVGMGLLASSLKQLAKFQPEHQCPNCSYNLTGSPSDICSECGCRRLDDNLRLEWVSALRGRARIAAILLLIFLIYAVHSQWG